MFRPESDRTDYGDMLKPPEDYHLEKAVGTTYSLDLETLIAATISLGLSGEMDSKLLQNPLSKLNALQNVADKVVLFCEAGQIHAPSKQNALAFLLEKMVVEVALPKDRSGYPAFHAKTWILSYANGAGNRKYRFLVLSRNLTFDRSWDVGFAMESDEKIRQKKKTRPILDFLEFLAGIIPDSENSARKKLVRALGAELADVSFSLGSKEFEENFEILPLGIGANSYRMTGDALFGSEIGKADSTFDELVVMTPFLSQKIIAGLNGPWRCPSEGKRTLITRRSELEKLKPSDVKNFSVYVLKDEIIDGESVISDEVAEKKMQDIHAKIYLRRKGDDVDLYFGSMNASVSALERNVEMMVRLRTKSRHLNASKFLADIFCGPANGAKNPFELVKVTDAAPKEEADPSDQLEQKIKELCRVRRKALVTEDKENPGKYRIEIEFEGISDDNGITVALFNSKREQALSRHLEFAGVEKSQLSEFYVIAAKSGEEEIRRVIKIPTTGFPDDRENEIFKSVVKDPQSLAEYIAILLGEDPVRVMLERNGSKKSGSSSRSGKAGFPIYEKMLRAAAYHPEKIREVGKTIEKISDSKIVGDEFRQLYETFCKALKIRS